MEDTNRDINIEEMLRGADKAEEPGTFTTEAVAREAGTDTIGEIKAVSVASAGYTWVYDTRTGIPSKINNNNIRSVLRKKREDGSYVFELKQRVKPKEGTFPCLLHSSDPNRQHYTDIGLAVCPKDNLASPYQVRRHMEKRHKMEWAAIEDERKVKEKEEDKAFQRLLMSKAFEEKAVGTPEAPLYVSDKPPKARKKRIVK